MLERNLNICLQSQEKSPFRDRLLSLLCSAFDTPKLLNPRQQSLTIARIYQLGHLESAAKAQGDSPDSGSKA